MQRDSTRTKVWFPLFSYFESSVDGIVPNEYDTPTEIICNLLNFFKSNLNFLKELQICLTAQNNENVNSNHMMNSVCERKSKNS